MSRTVWIILGLIGAALIALILTHDSGQVFGFEQNQFASFVVMGAWAVLIGAGVFTGGQRMGDLFKQLAIWIGIFLVLTSVYVFRFDLQDLGSRFTGGLIPGSPISATNEDGRKTVTLVRAPNGHFEADMRANGASVRFLVDTGASSIVLSFDDAQQAGIEVGSLNYSVRTQTANGTGRSARARLNTLELGHIQRRNVPVLVAERGKLDQSLLGQLFLESLTAYQKRGDRLTLED